MQKQRLSTAPSRGRWTSISTVLCIVIASSMLTACATRMPPSQARSPLPPSLTNECPSLSPLSDGTLGAVLRKLIEVSEQFYECQRKHRALVDAVAP
jgi:hypothetical protein